MKSIDVLMQPNSIFIEKKLSSKETTESGPVQSLTNSFSDVIKGMLKNTNDIQIESKDLSQKLVLGEIDNVHDVMIAVQKAQMALEFTIEIKNQLVKAIQTLERMQ